MAFAMMSCGKENPSSLNGIDYEYGRGFAHDRIVLGSSGIYGSDFVPENTSKIEIEAIPQSQFAYKEEAPAAEEEQKEEEIIEQAPPQPYIRRTGKPALILEPGDDIVKLETEPAYLRRNRNIQDQIISQPQPQQQAGSMRVETIDGQHHLSSNSFLHQTQD